MGRTKVQTIKQFERRAFWACAFCIALLVAGYSYFLGKSIVNVVVREELELEIAAVNSAISELEFQYLEKKNAVNRELAYELGYEFQPQKKFVVRKTLGGRHLTQNDAN